ncbi:hypothetical protein F8A86_07430 [Betaproteobacteria bacterium SCN1]|jgi:TolB-like protein|nr:hypothetical protein F8A86_07430 [Betaproteobacteria bacterium SCN1]
MRAIHTACLLLAAGLAVSGCAHVEAPRERAPQADIIAHNHTAAEALIGQVQASRLPKGSAVLIATLVNIDALETSSTLGRSISEQVGTKFSAAGYQVIELKLREGGVYLKRNEGELMLTREISQLAKSHNAGAVIVGTYAEAGSTVFINLKVVDPASNVVLAATDYALPMNQDVRTLLGKRAQRF